MNNIHIRTVWHPKLAKKTCELHRDILLTPSKKVYWGIVHDDEYPEEHKHILDKYLPEIQKQIAAGIRTYVFIEARDSYTNYLWGELTDKILKEDDFKDWKTSDLVPDYYKDVLLRREDLTVSYWLPLSKLLEIPNTLFQKARPITYEEFDTKKYGPYGRPYPAACEFRADKELYDFLRSTEVSHEVISSPDFIYSPDYRYIKLRGEEFRLTSVQAQVIEILHRNFLQGKPEIGQYFILEELGRKTSRLWYIFKSRREAWKKLIVSNHKGIFRLNI